MPVIPVPIFFAAFSNYADKPKNLLNRSNYHQGRIAWESFLLASVGMQIYF
jgi:hypothetical protein